MAEITSFPDSVLMLVCEGLGKNQAWADHSEEILQWGVGRTASAGLCSIFVQKDALCPHPPPRVRTGMWTHPNFECGHGCAGPAVRVLAMMGKDRVASAAGQLECYLSKGGLAFVFIKRPRCAKRTKTVFIFEACF